MKSILTRMPLALLLFAFVVATTRASAVLVHSYPCDAISGAQNVQDTIGNADGTLMNGATITHLATKLARGSGALALDGQDDYLDLPSITLGKKFTLMAWVLIPPGSSNIQTVIASGPSDPLLGSRSPGFRLFINEYGTANGRVVFEVGNGTQSTQTFTPLNTFVPGCYQQLAVAVDADVTDGTPTAEARIYYNGFELTDPATRSVLTDFDGGTGTASLDIGQMTNGVWPLGGWIDEISIFDSTLSRQEIRDAAGILQPRPAAAGPSITLPGLAFGPYVHGQTPDQCVSAEQLWTQLNLVAPYALRVRTYDSRADLEMIPRMAQELGLGVAMGVFLDADAQENQVRIDKLLESAEAGLVDTAVVGNEVLFDAELTLPSVCGATTETDSLICYLQQVRTELDASSHPEVKVTTAEPFDTLFQPAGGGGWEPRSPSLISALDIVSVNLYPFHDGVAIADARAALSSQYAQAVAAVESAAPGKPVSVSETGWPSEGEPVGAAVPSLSNASGYLRETLRWAEAQGIDLFYFEAFDEDWKGPETFAKHWGIWDADGNPKYIALPLLPGVSLAPLVGILSTLGFLALRRRNN